MPGCTIVATLNTKQYAQPFQHPQLKNRSPVGNAGKTRTNKQNTRRQQAKTMIDCEGAH
jgi:hypothetical protein